MAFVIRPGELDDADGVAQVQVAAWRSAYAHLLSADFLGALSEERSARSYRAGLQHGSAAWVAEDSGEIVGFAIVGRHDLRSSTDRSDLTEDDPPRDLELLLLYQFPVYHGSGTGQALLDAAVGDAPCFLWVATDNPRAQSFYRRNGLAFDGATKVESAWEDLQASRMVR